MPPSDTIAFNEAALESFFKERFKALCAHCQYRFGFETDTAKEVVHTGFVKLWENRERLSSGLPVEAYLYKIISNISADLLKHEKVKEKHARSFLQSPPQPVTGEDVRYTELKQLETDIDDAVNDLPEQMRKIFELSRFEGLTYAAIAAQLNISVKTVETQMSRALARLRQRLSRYLAVFLLVLFFIGKKFF